MNEKTIFEDQERDINRLSKKLTTAEAQLQKANDENYFQLKGNENAITYLENYDLDVDSVIAQVEDRMYDQNKSEGNPLIPFVSDDGGMRINKIKFLNHRWLIADFSGGNKWGEILVEYQYDENNELQLYVIKSLLYPNY